MATVEAFTLPEVDLKFMAHDHLEPHFHAISRQEGWDYRVFILEGKDQMFQAKRAGRTKFLPDPPRRDLERLVVEHRVALLDQWERDVQLQPGLKQPERRL